MPEHTGVGECREASEPVVTALLTWYDEDPAILRRAVTSTACIADHLVALDGRWDMWAGETRSSPPEQAQAIRDAAHDAGIRADIYPAQQWTSQVQKRNRLLWLGCNGSDWVLPIDADWEFTGDRDKIRHELEHATVDALVAPIHTPANDTADPDQTFATGWHRSMSGGTVYEPMIWRVLKDMRVENFHWCVYGTKNNQRVALWGNEGHVPQADTATLQAPFQVTHWCLYRDEQKVQTIRDYCDQRDRHVAAHGTEPT